MEAIGKTQINSDWEYMQIPHPLVQAAAFMEGKAEGAGQSQ